MDKRHEMTFTYDGVPPVGQQVTVSLVGAEFRGTVSKIIKRPGAHGIRKEHVRIRVGGEARYFTSWVNGEVWRCKIE